MKRIKPELLDLLERYIADNLSKKERTEFEVKLQEDDELADLLDFYLAFEAEKEDFGRILMKQELQKIDAEMEKEASNVSFVVIAEERLQQLAVYAQKTLKEVSLWFQPVAEYNHLLGVADRSNSRTVRTPVLGKDYTDESLTFEIDPSGNCLVIIENNKREKLVERPIQETEKKVIIDVKDFPMGVYYWKFMDLSNESVLIGDFLITMT